MINTIPVPLGSYVRTGAGPDYDWHVVDVAPTNATVARHGGEGIVRQHLPHTGLVAANPGLWSSYDHPDFRFVTPSREEKQVLSHDASRTYLRHPYETPRDANAGKPEQVETRRLVELNRDRVRLAARPPATDADHAVLETLRGARLVVMDASPDHRTLRNPLKFVGTESTATGDAAVAAREVGRALDHLETAGLRGVDGRGKPLTVVINGRGLLENAKAEDRRQRVLSDHSTRESRVVFGTRLPMFALGPERYEQRSVVMHEIAHTLLHNVFSDESLHQLEPVARVEAAAVHEGFADVLAATYTKSWKIGAVNGWLPVPSTGHLRQILLSTPSLGLVQPPLRDIKRGISSGARMARTRSDVEQMLKGFAIDSPPDHYAMSGLVSTTMRDIRKANHWAWPQLEKLALGSLEQMRATPDFTLSFASWADATRGAATQLFGANEARTVAKILTRRGL